VSFGARMLKTGIAVTLSLYICAWLQLSPPVIAAVAAIFAMQPSLYRSWRYFLEQLQTNTLGAVIAMLAGMFFSKEPIAIGVVCIVVIMICLKIKMADTIGLTLVTVVSVMEASGQWDFALNRFLLSLIGIVSAFLINIIFLPPKPKEQFTDQIHDVFNQLSLLLRTVISDEMKKKVFREQKQKLQDALRSLSDKYKLLEEELKKPAKRVKYRQTRHVVVYKQMLYTLQKGYEVLDAVEEHYFQADRTEETDESYDRHLEKLIKFHEHVMLKFDDKLKPYSSESAAIEDENDRFIKTATDCYSQGQDGSLRLFVVAAAMYDYGFQTRRLDRLVAHWDGGEEEKDA
jgi:uncharacterized membrane protein YgaE (UPF0421/DUF939 family)